MDLSPRLFAPRYWPTWICMGLLRLSAHLPFAVLLALGAALGFAARQLPLRYVGIARRNLELCFPELDVRQRELLLRRHFRSLGIALFETAVSWWGSDRRIRRLTQLEGLEHVERALEEGRGAILLLGHFTIMEIAGRALGARIPVNILYRPTANEVLDWFLRRYRCRHGGRAISRDDVRSLFRALKANEIVWYAPDQSYRKKGAQMVPFFDIPAPTNTSTSRLARTSGAPVMLYLAERLPGTLGYRMVISPPLEGFPSEDPVADSLRYHRALEQHIRKVPDQYLWIHRRFKGLDGDTVEYYEPKRQ